MERLGLIQECADRSSAQALPRFCRIFRPIADVGAGVPQRFLEPLEATSLTTAASVLQPQTIRLAAFGTLSISAVRHIYLFEFVAGMVLAEAAHGRFRERRESSRLHGAALAAVTVSVGMALLGEKTPLEVFFSPPYRGNAITESSANFIDASGMRGPVRNDYNLGNDLVYRFYPRIAVSMDSRIDAYGQQLFEQNHAAVTRGPETLRSAPKHMIVTAERIEELSEAGFPRQYPDWKMVYRDSIVAIYSQDSNVWRYAWSVKEQAQRAKDSMDSRRLRGDSSKYDESGRGEEAEGAGR